MRGSEDEKEKQSICQVNQNKIDCYDNCTRKVSDILGVSRQEPTDDGEGSDEAAKWLEEGIDPLLICHPCCPQSFLQGSFSPLLSTISFTR